MTRTTSRPHDVGGTRAVVAEGLVKDFGSNRAVDHVDLDIARGEIFGVLGPNGAGKTTTLRMLATLLPIDDGRAEIFGVDVARQPHAVRQLIGLTGQYASVDEDLTATENLVLFARLQGIVAPRARTIASDLLEQFSLQDAARRRISKFSGGMRRRLDLAVSLITRPPLIFLDEPTTGLDPRTRGEMWQTIRTLVADGATVLLTTQYLEEADQLADRIAVIDRGRTVAEGTPEQLKSSVGSSTLQVDLREEADGARARDVVALALGVEVRLERDHLQAPLPDADRAIDALSALRASGIAVREIQVSKPSLDEVFLTLTGRPATSEDPTADAGTDTGPASDPTPAAQVEETVR